jgi:putative transposase
VKLTVPVKLWHGSVGYDERILRWFAAEVSIWATAGRQRLPFVCGERQRTLLPFQQGESDLAYRGGEWYLLATVNQSEPEPIAPDGVLGIDLGIVNLATDSLGTSYSGAAVEANRRRYARLRARVQAVGTKSAKRKLKRMAGKQARFQGNENHRISKQMVATANGTNQAITLEELTGMRLRVTARHDGRARPANWSFAQPRHCITYKSARFGVPVVLVDSRNTSRQCPACGHCEKANRVTQCLFSCQSCGYSASADYIAACNIASWGAANHPIVGGTYHGTRPPTHKPLPLGMR